MTDIQDLAVPRDALVLRQNGSFVFRVTAENKAEQIRVDIGNSADELIHSTLTCIYPSSCRRCL